jgi:hypothetical protein
MGGPMLALGLIRAWLQYMMLLAGLATAAIIIGTVRGLIRGLPLPPEELRHRRFMRPNDNATGESADPPQHDEPA